MKKFFSIPLLLAVTIPGSAWAATTAAPVPKLNYIKANTVPGLELPIFNFLFALIGALILLYIIISGIRYMMAGGNPDQLQKAKHSLVYAIIGLLIAFFSYIILAYTGQIISAITGH